MLKGDKMVFDEILKVGTLFSGIGAPEVALKLSGINHEIEFACESDIQARETYITNNTCNYLYNDINCIDLKTIPYVDLLVFGFPCQSFSNAGKKKGFNDPRGKLVLKAINILSAIKPLYFVAENVKGLEWQNNGKTMDTLLNKMYASGYNVYYKTMDSKDFGVPQQRKRIIFVGIRKDLRKKYIFPSALNKKVSLKSVLDSKVDKNFFATSSFLSKEKVIAKLKSYNKEYIPCLTHTIARNGSSGEYISYIAAVNKAISQKRKPTPRECLRLHGFPEQFKIPEGISITSQYRQVGNTMTIPLFVEVFKKLVV